MESNSFSFFLFSHPHVVTLSSTAPITVLVADHPNFLLFVFLKMKRFPCSELIWTDSAINDFVFHIFHYCLLLSNSDLENKNPYSKSLTQCAHL